MTEFYSKFFKELLLFNKWSLRSCLVNNKEELVVENDMGTVVKEGPVEDVVEFLYTSRDFAFQRENQREGFRRPMGQRVAPKKCRMIKKGFIKGDETYKVKFGVPVSQVLAGLKE